jgi:hypothetical protein
MSTARRWAPCGHWVAPSELTVTTFTTFARLVEAPAAEPSGGRMRPGRHDHFDGDDDDPVDWEVMVAVCVDRLALFTAKERKFIVTLQGWGGEPSPKQLNWLAALFRRSA